MDDLEMLKLKAQARLRLKQQQPVAPAAAPVDQVAPERVDAGRNYLISDMEKDPDLLDSARRYYGAQGHAWENDQDLIDTYALDMRKVDNNLVASVGRLNEIKAAGATNDVQRIQDLKVLHSKWREKNSLGAEPFGEGVEGLMENIVAGVTDPASLMYLLPGGLFAKTGTGLATKFAVSTALDAALGAGMNYTTQKAEQGVGMRPEGPVDKMEMLEAGALGAAPGVVIGAGKVGYRVGKAVKEHYFSPTELRDRGNVDTKFLDRIIPQKDAEKYTKNIAVETKGTGERLYTFTSDKEVTKDLDNAGMPVAFRSQKEAETYAKTNFPNAANMTKEQLAEPGNGTGWFIAEKRFNTPIEAKAFLAEHGDIVGSKNPKDYVFYRGDFKSLESPGVSPRMSNIRLTLQRHVDRFLTIRNLEKEGRGIIEKRIKDDPLNPAASKWAELLGDDPYMIGVNNQNAKLRSFWFLDIKPLELADDPLAPGTKMYRELDNEKSFREIRESLITKFAANGIMDQITPVKEFGGYVFAKRMQAEHAAGLAQGNPYRTGVNMKEADAFVKGIEADPVRAKIYQEGVDDLRRFDQSLLKFAVDHDLNSQAQMNALVKNNDFYLPIHRLYDASYMLHTDNKGVKANTLTGHMREQAKPGGQFFLDPFEAYAQQIEAVVTAATENRYKKKLYDWIGAMGPGEGGKWAIAKPNAAGRINVSVASVQKALEDALGKGNVNVTVTTQNAPIMALWVKNELLKNHPDLDFYYDGGKRKIVQIRDLLLFDAMKAGGPELNGAIFRAVESQTIGGKFGKYVRGYQEWYAKTVVHDPALNLLKFMPNDAFFGWIHNPQTNLTLKTFVTDLPFLNITRGLAHDLTDKETREFFLNGGGMAGLRSNTQNYKDNLIAHAAKYDIDPGSLLGLGPDKDVGLVRKVTQAAVGQTGLGWIAQKTENSVRLGNYMNARARGLSAAEASLQSANASVDWRLHGTSMASTQVQRAIGLFFRARINSLYQRQRSLLTADFGGKATMGKWMKLGMYTVAMPLIYEAIWGDKVRESFSEKTLDNYYMFPVDPSTHESGYVAMPKYPEEWWIGNLVRKYMVELHKSEQGRATWGVMMSYMMDVALNISGVDDPLTMVAPPWAAAVAQVATDKQGNADITRQSEQGLSPHLQGDVRDTHYSVLNSPTFRHAVQVFNDKMSNSLFQSRLSPEHVYILARGFVGTLAKYGLDMADYMYKEQTGTYSLNPYDLPFVREIYRPNKPGRYTAYEDQLFDYEHRVVNIANDIKSGENQGKVNNLVDAAARLQAEPEKYGKYLAAAELIQKTVQERQKTMQEIAQIYAQQTGNTRTGDIEKTVDALFAKKNAELIPMVKEIQKMLESKDDADK